MTLKASLVELSTGDLSSQASSYISAERFADARDFILQIPRGEKTADLEYLLGEAYKGLGKINEAVVACEAALKRDPACHRAYALLGEMLLSQGHVFHALDHYALAIKAQPEELSYRHVFLTIANLLHIKAFNRDLKDMLLDCLTVESLDYAQWPKVWGELIFRDPAFKGILKALGKDGSDSYPAFAKALTLPTNRKSLLDPYFLQCLKKVTISAVVFEKWVTYLRRFLMDDFFSAEKKFSDDEFITLAMALSRYALRTDYIFEITAAEQDRLEALEERVISSDQRAMCLLSCYLPVANLDKAEEIADQNRLSFPEFVTLHLSDIIAQKKIREKIPAITKIDDSTSLSVGAQYEKFPYPRWTGYSGTVFNEKTEGNLKGKKARILVAGCGTGREAIDLAVAIPDSRILAVDLSRTSLAYGIKRAEDFKIENIEFRQGDILRLGDLEEKFDYIASGGVLHHMKDPAQGLAVLTGLLKPGCFMRLGLYSDKARRFVTRAQKVISEKKYPSDAEGIRSFRRNAQQVLEKDVYANICSFTDYFCLPECRDLLFHVQEHCFTIQSLKEFLSSQNLEFSGFYHHPQVFMQYRKAYPDDPEARNLDNWAVFEDKNPDTFREMYRFWCRKKS